MKRLYRLADCLEEMAAAYDNEWARDEWVEGINDVEEVLDIENGSVMGYLEQTE